MNLNFLAICIGNTSTQLGTFVAGELTDRYTPANDDAPAMATGLQQAMAPLHDKPDAIVVVSSVQPAVCAQVCGQLAQQTKAQLFRVEQDMPIPIGRQLDAAANVGEDRLLNAAAAFDVLRQACVVVDAGTAITVDFVDGAGTYHGGAIAPGARLMLSAMHDRAAQLPEVQWQRPIEPIGHSTAEAMRSGVFHGLRGMLRELTEQYAEVAGSYPMVVATGGDALVLFDAYELVDRIVPDLALHGIEATVRVAVDGAED